LSKLYITTGTHIWSYGACPLTSGPTGWPIKILNKKFGNSKNSLINYQKYAQLKCGNKNS